MPIKLHLVNFRQFNSFTAHDDDEFWNKNWFKIAVGSGQKRSSKFLLSKITSEIKIAFQNAQNTFSLY